MHEILRHLPPGARVLDLACGAGSFQPRDYPFRTVTLDLDRAARPEVQADAAGLPFRAAAFDAVISNHGLEHIARLEAALREIGRVLKRPGALYVAVPDASTFTDRLYRWLGRGGGHLNAFTAPEPLAREIERHTGLAPAGVRLLYTSLSFLNSKNFQAPPPRRTWLLAGGAEWFVKALNIVLRLSDRWFSTRAGVYGWALYFGSVGEPVSSAACPNVCVRCGAGHPTAWLTGRAALQRRFLVRTYACPACGTRNPLFSDSRI